MSYPGGKQGAGVYQQIINRIPPHEIYIEPFLGSGAILRLKSPATHSIGIDADPDVINSFPGARTPNLTLIAGDSLFWLQTQSLPSSTFIYCDPPYLMGTRRTAARIYKHEFTDGNHMALLSVLKRLPCLVMISGYPNAMYDDVLSSWWTHTFQTTNRGGGYVTEKLWMNYSTPSRLHDYRYLGNNFRERERIKRKTSRWVARLIRMPDLERFALSAAIAEIDALGSGRQKERAAPFSKLEDITIRLPREFVVDNPSQDPIAANDGGRSTDMTGGDDANQTRE